MLTKEQLRQQRNEAYRKAEAKRDADPKYIALKNKQDMQSSRTCGPRATPKDNKLGDGYILSLRQAKSIDRDSFDVK